MPTPNDLRTWLNSIRRLPLRLSAAAVSPETAVEQTAEKLAFTANVELRDLQQKEGQPPKRATFAIVAYTGAAVRLGNFRYPIITDLSGLRAARSRIPILLDHDPTQIVGQGTVHIDSAGVRIEGTVTGDDGAAAKVVTHAKNGFEWQASIGASVDRLELVAEGKTAVVNGRQVMGPHYIAREATLHETSFTAMGADGQTSAAVAASLSQGDGTMNFEQWLQQKGWDPATLAADLKASLKLAYDAEVKAGKFTAPAAGATTPSTTPSGATVTQTGGAPTVTQSQPGGTTTVVPTQPGGDPIALMRSEHLRLAAIDRHCGSRFPEIRAEATEKGWSADEVELRVLRASRSSQGTAIHVVQHDVGPNVLQAATLASLRYQGLDKLFDDKTLQAAHTQFRARMTLHELVMNLAWQNGFQGHSFRRDMSGAIRAAFSTMQASEIFSNVANKYLLASFMATEQAWREIASIRSVSDLKESSAYRLTADAEFKEVGADGELVHGDIDDESFSNQADTYGRIFGITRKHFINDDLGALEAMPKIIGRGAGLKLNKLFWTEWLDNAAFFTTALLNYFEGAGTVLAIDSLTTAEQMFLDQKDSNGDPIGLMATKLLVPTSLSAKGAQLYNSTEIRDTTANTKGPTANPHAGKFKPVVSSYLNNANYSGYSATAWHLVANPEDLAAIEVVLLNGQDSPIVETVEAEADKLGLYFRGYFDVGVRKQDHRAAVKSKGAA